MDKPVPFVFLVASIFSLGLSINFFPLKLMNLGIPQAICCAEIETVQPPYVFAPNAVQSGLQFVDFQVNRTTFGFVDEDYLQPFDHALANKKVAIGCDSMRLEMVAIISNVPANDSLGFRMIYGNPNGTTLPTEILVFGGGHIQIKRISGPDFTCPFPSNAVSVTTNQGIKSLDFKLKDCLSSFGQPLSVGDSIKLFGDFYVNPNGPFTSDFEIVPGLSAFAFETQNGSFLPSDTLTDSIRIARTEVVYDFPNTLNGLPNGCDEGQLSWRLFVPDNDFSDWFGIELRPATKIDSIVFDFDPNILTAFSGGQIEVSIPGHPLHGSNYFGVRPLTDFPGGHYVAMFDTLTKIPSLNNVQNYSFDLRLKLKPSCKALVGSLDGDNVYEIASKIAYTDRYYAKYIGDGSCSTAKTDEAVSSMAYVSPPALSLSPITSSTAQLVNGFATWDIEFCNEASQSDANNTWLALEDPSGLLNIGAIADITNAGNPIPILPTSYSQGFFVLNSALNAGECKRYRIVATTSTCDDVVLNARVGWDCTGYPNNWNPSQNAPCSSESMQLFLQNPGISAVQLGMNSVKSTCMGTGETVELNGSLMSAAVIGSDTYLLDIIGDENNDGIVQTTEPILQQLQLTGPVSPQNPLNINAIVNVDPSQFCGLIIKIESLNNNGCNSFTSYVELPAFENAGQNRSLCSVQGMYSTVIGDSTTACDTMLYSFHWSAIAPASNQFLNDTNLLNPQLSFDPSLYLGQTLSFILKTVRPCGLASFDTVSILVPLADNGVFEDENVLLLSSDCTSNAQYCANISPQLLPNFVFMDNGAAYTGGFNACSSGFSIQLSPGLHNLIANDTISNCQDTVLVQVNCTTTDTIELVLSLGASDTVCFSSNELPGMITNLSNICQDDQFADYQVFNDSCVIVSGDLVGQETACWVICDGNGFCDTTVLSITVVHPFSGGLSDSITLTQTHQICFDEQNLNLTGNLISFENICPSQSGLTVDFVIDNLTNCISYTGTSIGTDIACLRFCDDLGNCDTISLTVAVLPGNVVEDTIFLSLETDTFCLPTGVLPGALVGIENICPSEADGQVNFTEISNCIIYTGQAIGTDTACYRFEDEFGNVAIYELRITVRKTTPNTVCDTIFVGQSKLHCLDLSELPSDFADGSIREICADERTGNVELTINESGACVFYLGKTEGRDSSCIVYCDEFGICDTTYLCLFVKPYFDPPSLGPDIDSTLKGTPIVIDFLANDTIYGGIEDIYVLTTPLSGTVVLNLDNSFTYIPNENECAHWDEFQYVACNPNGCDTTTVSIYLQCIELTIFTAVSPNNDGVNDFFYIAKVEEFPNNHLWVYNIWGSLVYETTAYNNTWPGTWGADTDLPDGTYYFIFEWTDNGKTTVQKGYIEMFR